MAARRKEVSPYTHRKLSEESIRGEHRALRHFCKWLLKHKLISENPMDLVEAPSPTETVPRIATDQTAITLALAAGGSKYPLRDQALVLVLADTGARLSEFLGITIDNLVITHDVDGDHGEVRLLGKGRRRRRLLIGRTALTTLCDWIAERPPEAGSCIWWSDRGAPLTESGVRLILRRLSRRAGLPEDINPHAFRHGCAVDAITHGADLRTVQLLLGHSQITTTVHYLALADQAIKTSHDRISDARFGALELARPATHPRPS
jgi:site-specific recombinase XerD